MPGQFSYEVVAIQQLRAKFPSMGQRTLATRITNGEFTDEANRALARRAGAIFGRSMLSTYSVIRRFDKANARQLQTA